MILSQEREIKRLLVLARVRLIRARIAKQVEQRHRDHIEKNGYDNSSHLAAMMCKEEARLSRTKAREALRLVENKNGMAYLNGQAVFPLKVWLKGHAFREWIEHEREYEKVSLFQGSDPC